MKVFITFLIKMIIGIASEEERKMGYLGNGCDSFLLKTTQK
jgi:hypothetical protein